MREKHCCNVGAQSYCKQALFGLRGDEMGVITQGFEPYLSTFVKTSDIKTDPLRKNVELPLMADDVAVTHLFLAWSQGRNPGSGVAPAHYFVNDHRRQCETVKQDCVQAFLRYNDALPQVDDEVVALAYRFIRAQSGILTEVDEKTVTDSVILVNRVIAFNARWFGMSASLGDAQENPLRLRTTLSQDTVWITVRSTKDEIDKQLLMSLLVSFIFLKRDGRDPFNQLKYIGMFNPWTDRIDRWDMQAFHPGVYNAIINVIEG